MFCASAFAGTDNTVVVPSKQQVVKKVHKACYTYITGSAIPQPCDRLSVLPTTANEIDRVGGSHN